MAAQPTVARVAEEVVDQPEEPEHHDCPEDEQAGGGRVGVADPHHAEERSTPVDGYHGRHEKGSDGGGQDMTAVVLPLEERRREHLAGRGEKDRGRGQSGGEGEDDRHVGPISMRAPGPGSAMALRTRTGTTTISIVAGTAIDESLATRPTDARTASPAAAAVVGG